MPTVYTRTPMDLAISLAVLGSMRPPLFSPSVSRMMTLLFEGEFRRRSTPVARPEPMAVPSSSKPLWTLNSWGFEDVPVGGEGAHGKGFAGEDHEPDAIGGAVIDKLRGYILCRLHPVGSEILGEHGAADIEAEDDVDTFAVHELFVVAGLGSGQGDDKTAEGQQAEDEQHRAHGNSSTTVSRGRRVRMRPLRSPGFCPRV